MESAISDGARLNSFVEDLVGLERRAYEAAIRAIRRYVTGLHRIGDDLELAYSMIVASIESLAQEFDNFTPVWADYPQEKGRDIELALEGSDPVLRNQLQSVLLKHEHLALARRYREFALAHIEPKFFREEALDSERPIGSRDLPSALNRAYRFRSRYLHQLVELPRQLTLLPFAGDAVLVDGKPSLTFQGLARLARHVICNFIARGTKVDRESFNYREQLPGVVTLPLAERYWVGGADGYGLARHALILAASYTSSPVCGNRLTRI